MWLVRRLVVLITFNLNNKMMILRSFVLILFFEILDSNVFNHQKS